MRIVLEKIGTELVDGKSVRYAMIEGYKWYVASSVVKVFGLARDKTIVSHNVDEEDTLILDTKWNISKLTKYDVPELTMINAAGIDALRQYSGKNLQFQEVQEDKPSTSLTLKYGKDVDALADSFLNPKVEKAMIGSKEIAERTGKRHDHVIRDIKKMFEQLYGEDLHSPNLGCVKDQTLTLVDGVSVYVDYRGLIGEISLDKEHAECLVTGYNAKLRMAVIKRMHELEEIIQKGLIPDFHNPLAAGKAWVEQSENAYTLAAGYVEKIEEIKRNEPYVTYAKAVENDARSLNMLEMAKTIGWGRNTLMKWLRDNKYLTKDNLPTSYSMNHKLFEAKQTPYRDQYGNRQTSIKPLITPKGEIHLVRKMKRLGLISASVVAGK